MVQKDDEFTFLEKEVMSVEFRQKTVSLVLKIHDKSATGRVLTGDQPAAKNERVLQLHYSICGGKKAGVGSLAHRVFFRRTHGIQIRLDSWN